MEDKKVELGLITAEQSEMATLMAKKRASDQALELENIKRSGKVTRFLQIRQVERTVLQKASAGPLEVISNSISEQITVKRSGKRLERRKRDGGTKWLVGNALRETGGVNFSESQKKELENLRSLRLVEQGVANRDMHTRAARMFHVLMHPTSAGRKPSSILVTGYEPTDQSQVAEMIRQQSQVVIDNIFNIPTRNRRVLSRLTSVQQKMISETELSKTHKTTDHDSPKEFGPEFFQEGTSTKRSHRKGEKSAKKTRKERKHHLKTNVTYGAIPPQPETYDKEVSESRQKPRPASAGDLLDVVERDAMKPSKSSPNMKISRKKEKEKDRWSHHTEDDHKVEEKGNTRWSRRTEDDHNAEDESRGHRLRQKAKTKLKSMFGSHARRKDLRRQSQLEQDSSPKDELETVTMATDDRMDSGCELDGAGNETFVMDVDSPQDERSGAAPEGGHSVTSDTFWQTHLLPQSGTHGKKTDEQLTSQMIFHDVPPAPRMPRQTSPPHVFQFPDEDFGGDHNDYVIEALGEQHPSEVHSSSTDTLEMEDALIPEKEADSQRTPLIVPAKPIATLPSDIGRQVPYGGHLDNMEDISPAFDTMPSVDSTLDGSSTDPNSPMKQIFQVGSSTDSDAMASSRSSSSVPRFKRFFSSPQLSVTSDPTAENTPFHSSSMLHCLHTCTPHGPYLEVNPFSLQFEEALNNNKGLNSKSESTNENQRQCATTPGDLPPHLMEDPGFLEYASMLDRKPNKADYVSYKIALIGDKIDMQYNQQLNQALEGLLIELVKKNISWEGFSNASKKLMVQGLKVSDGIFMIPVFGRRLVEFLPNMRDTIASYTQDVMEKYANDWILESGGWGSLMEHYSQAEITPSDYDSWEELTEEIYRVHREDSASDDGDSDDLYDFFSPDAMYTDLYGGDQMHRERNPYTLPRLTQEMRGGSVSTRNPPKQSDDKTTNYAHIRQPSNNTYLIPEYNGPCHLRRRVKSVEVLLGSDTDDGSQSPHSPAFRGYPFHKPTSSIKIPNGRIRIRSDYHSTDFDDKSTPKVISLGSGKFDDSLPPKRQGSMGSITSSSSIIQIVTGDEPLPNPDDPTRLSVPHSNSAPLVRRMASSCVDIPSRASGGPAGDYLDVGLDSKDDKKKRRSSLQVFSERVAAAAPILTHAVGLTVLFLARR